MGKSGPISGALEAPVWPESSVTVVAAVSFAGVVDTEEAGVDGTFLVGVDVVELVLPDQGEEMAVVVLPDDLAGEDVLELALLDVGEEMAVVALLGDSAGEDLWMLVSPDEAEVGEPAMVGNLVMFSAVEDL